jgi:adenosylmethionine-8-amino-7-oxononanoate aminotransferase
VRIPGPYHYVSNSPLSPEDFGRQCLSQTEATILREGPETIAGLFAEPIQGAGRRHRAAGATYKACARWPANTASLLSPTR